MTTTGPSNFGPLTTIFTPPSWCSTEKWIRHNTNTGGTVLRWGATCDAGTIGFASECYPSGWTGSNASALSYKGFSPGYACPMGFTGAASASRIEQSKHFVLSEYVTDLGEYDVATACCPRNYNYNGHFCVSHTLSFASPRTFLATSGTECIQTTSFKYFQSIGDSPTGQATFQAYPVIIVQDSRSSTSLAPAQTSSIDSQPSSGLSTGAKIAIGVCVPVAIIIIAAIAFIMWHRRRRSQKAAAAAASAAQGPNPTLYRGKSELDAGAQVNPYERRELEADGLSARDKVVSEIGSEVPLAELPAQDDAAMYEMAGGTKAKGQDAPRAELPGAERDAQHELDVPLTGGGQQGEAREGGTSRSPSPKIGQSPTGDNTNRT